MEKLFSKLEVRIPVPFRRGDILWDPSGEPGIPYEEDSTPFVLDYIPNWNEAEQETNGFVPGEKFYQRKGENGKYESRFKDPPRDYGAYGVTVVGMSFARAIWTVRAVPPKTELSTAISKPL